MHKPVDYVRGFEQNVHINIYRLTFHLYKSVFLMFLVGIERDGLKSFIALSDVLSGSEYFPEHF